jgi:hypothetical protein
MKKRLPRKLELSRETLRSLGKTHLREAAGGRSDTCPWICGSGPNTACYATCLCSDVICE